MTDDDEHQSWEDFEDPGEVDGDVEREFEDQEDHVENDGANTGAMEADAEISQQPEGALKRTARRAQEKPFISAKGISLTYTQAKLMGLTALGDGANDNLLSTILREQGNRSPQTKKFSRGHMENLSKPKPVSPSSALSSADKKCTFKWSRTNRAEAAMRDPACGYDFINNNGPDSENFLARMEANNENHRKKLAHKRAEEDYEKRLDKLVCPKCGKEQTYEEFSKKKKSCQGCNVPFTTNGGWDRGAWEARQHEYEERRKERIAKQEQERMEKLSKPKESRQQRILKDRAGHLGFLTRMQHDAAIRTKKEEERLASLNHIERADFSPVLQARPPVTNGGNVDNPAGAARRTSKNKQAVIEYEKLKTLLS